MPQVTFVGERVQPRPVCDRHAARSLGDSREFDGLGPDRAGLRRQAKHFGDSSRAPHGGGTCDGARTGNARDCRNLDGNSGAGPHGSGRPAGGARSRRRAAPAALPHRA